VDDCIDAAKSFDIYIASLRIPLNLIGCNNGSANETLNRVALTLEVPDERCPDETRCTCNCDALWN
jgi:hypothetical protein